MDEEIITLATRISYLVTASFAGQYPHPRVYLRGIFDLQVDGTARGGKFGFVIAVYIEELGCAVEPVAHWDELATCKELPAGKLLTQPAAKALLL